MVQVRKGIIKKINTLAWYRLYHAGIPKDVYNCEIKKLCNDMTWEDVLDCVGRPIHERVKFALDNETQGLV